MHFYLGKGPLMFLVFVLAGLFAILVFLIFFILRSPIALRISLVADLSQLSLNLHFYFRGKVIRTVTFGESSIDLLYTKAVHRFSLEGLQESWQYRHDVIKSAKRNLHISDLIWITSAGTGEADQAALLCGMIWSVKCAAMPFFTNWLDDPPPKIEVIPLFQEQQLRTKLSCMIACRAGDAISMAWHMSRIIKEGEHDGRTSDSRADENGA
ncbi:MAG: DUF2953 domain-containing protein [Sporolactobacillus sp.]